MVQVAIREVAIPCEILGANCVRIVSVRALIPSRAFSCKELWANWGPEKLWGPSRAPFSRNRRWAGWCFTSRWCLDGRSRQCRRCHVLQVRKRKRIPQLGAIVLRSTSRKECRTHGNECEGSPSKFWTYTRDGRISDDTSWRAQLWNRNVRNNFRLGRRM